MYKNNFIVVIKHKEKILRELDGEVSLPFGSQYSILLKNKDSRRVLVDIEVDGKNVLSGNSLIIEGHISQEIKGFMRNMSVTNRFKFIKKTKEISDYRGDRVDDGLVVVNYRFEKRKYEPVVISKKSPDYWPDIRPCPSIKYAACNMTLPIVPSYTVGCKVAVSGADLQGGIVDDGITVKGSKITQQYQYGDIENLEQASYVIILKLKGVTKRDKKIVKKPLTIKTKLRCPTCGRRSKSSSTFCYNCGTYLERV